MIRVEYTGRYPNTCRGVLTIFQDDEEIYSRSHCCSSTGGVYFYNGYADVDVRRGELVWNDGDNFSREIQEAVKQKLSGYTVCCGGCV